MLQSAKKLAKTVDPQGKRAAAIDFHILYDTSDAQLERIRDAWRVDDGKTLLTGRPYLVLSYAGAGSARDQASSSTPSVYPRDFTRLLEMLRAVKDHDPFEEQPKLPNKLLHELRHALFLGRNLADARLKLTFSRYADLGLKNLLGSQHSLFWRVQAPEEEAQVLYRTGLLDALDTAEFWLDIDA
ncbi:MAG: hypothetical protein KatS3mg113_1045 [Planctomycetaceae bacterium]|nr:MAG: hypothetical protein KatS3mg113_1045 [Planctomycetaceae bacterium]